MLGWSATEVLYAACMTWTDVAVVREGGIVVAAYQVWRHELRADDFCELAIDGQLILPMAQYLRLQSPLRDFPTAREIVHSRCGHGNWVSEISQMKCTSLLSWFT